MVSTPRYRGYVYDTETQLYYLQSRYYNPQIGRFMNADALVATGQGLLGNNMFAYCLNNPISLIDPSGDIPIWFQIFSDHDYGYIHRAVQMHILITENVKSLIYDKEYVIAGIGRADIIDLSTNEVWEIKHGGSTDIFFARGVDSASSQVIKYTGIKTGLKKGGAGRFEGAFIIEQGSSLYRVFYSTPAEGVIIYTVKEIPYDPEVVPDFVYKKFTLYEKPKYGWLVVGFAFGPGGSCELYEREVCFGGEW